MRSLLCRVVFTLTLAPVASLQAQTCTVGSLATTNSIGVTASDPCNFVGFYDPDLFVNASGTRTILAQGTNPGCATGVADSIYKATQGVSGWAGPGTSTCGTMTGLYANLSCTGYTNATLPQASPSVVKVGSRYFMAFVGGNADSLKGHVFWAVSNDGVSWSKLNWFPPPGYNWRPLIYPKAPGACDRVGIGQVSVVYDATVLPGFPEGAFYFYVTYWSSSFVDHFWLRMKYTSSDAFGLGPMQICLNAPGTGCTWVAHSGILVFNEDTGVQPEPGDPRLGHYISGQNLKFGTGDIEWNPIRNKWLRVVKEFTTDLWAQETTDLSSGIWTSPVAVNMTTFHSQMLSRYPATYSAAEVYEPGLYHGTFGSRTGLWLVQPVDHNACPSYWSGTRVMIAGLTCN